jgi:hypothetical protein
MYSKFIQFNQRRIAKKLKAEQIGIDASSDTTCKHNIYK